MLRRLKSLWKPLGIICIVGLVVALCGMGLWHLRDAAALRELKEARSRLRDQGVDVTFDDVRGAPPPEDENAAPLYEAAFKRLEEEDARILEDEESEGDLPLALEDPRHLEEAAAEDLDRYEPSVELLRRAVERPRCAFRIENKGFGTPLPHIPPLRKAMNLMLKSIAKSLGIRVSRRGLTEDEWFQKVKAEVEAAGVGIEFSSRTGRKRQADGSDGRAAGHGDPAADH